MSVSESQSEARAVLEGFPSTWKRIVTDPHGALADMPETGGLQQPATFLVICAAINALGHVLRGWGPLAVLAVFAWQLVAAVVMAALFVLIAQNLFDGRGGFEPTFRIVAWAWAPLVVYWVPVLGVLAWLYSGYLLLRGLERAQRLDATQAALTLVISVAILWVLRSVRTGGPAWI